MDADIIYQTLGDYLAVKIKLSVFEVKIPSTSDMVVDLVFSIPKVYMNQVGIRAGRSGRMMSNKEPF